MDPQKLMVVFAIGVIFLTVKANGQWNGLPNGGENYIFGIQEGFGQQKITLYISSEGTATVQVEAPYVAMNSTRVIKDTTISMSLGTNLALSGSSLSSKGVSIKSDKRILVHVLMEDLYRRGSNDGFLTKPIHTNSKEFFIFTYTQNLRPNEFLIASTIDNTSIFIEIKLPSGSVQFEGKYYSNGHVIRKVLNKHDTLQLQSGGDLTGTYVESSQPIAVLSGNKCLGISRAYCDVVVDQLIPISEWKHEYITSILEISGTAFLRIIASKENTELKINNQIVKSLNRGEYYERNISSPAVLSIKASQPIGVVQFYDPRDASRYGDPFMVMVPAIDQFLDSYSFEVPADYSNNYLVLYIETSKAGGVLIDGNAARFTTQRTIDLPDTGLAFSAGRIAVTKGKHKLTHVIPGTRFGALLYGLELYTSYGFFLGYSSGPVCTPSCQNNGTCIAGNTCHCQRGYRGQRCELGLALASELKPRLYTLVDGDDTNFMDPLAWYADPPISDTNKACYVKLLLQNSPIETITTAMSSTTDGVEYGNFTAGPIDSTAGVTGSTRFACLEVRCPFVTMDGDLRDTVVDVSLSGNNSEACRVSNHNNHVTNFTVQSEPSKSDKIHVILEVGKNYGPYYGVYMAIGKRDKAKFLAEHKCNSGHEYDYENYNPGTGILAEYVC